MCGFFIIFVVLNNSYMEFKKVDLNFDLKGLDGAPIKDANAAKLIANLLASTVEGDARKLWPIVLKLQAGEVLELNEEDATALDSFIADHPGLSILAKGQILSVI